MAKREDIETAIWSDPSFLALSGSARSVYIWSFTNQRTGMAGIYKVAREQIAFETGFDGKRLSNALAELQERRFLYYDGTVLFVRTRVKRMRQRGDTIAKSIASDLDSIGAHRFVELWWMENEKREWATVHAAKPVFTGSYEGSTSTPPGPQVGSLGYGSGNGLSVVSEEQQPSAEKLPRDFPDEVVPHLDAAFPALCEMAERHEAKAVSRYQVAKTVMTRARKPLVQGAHDCAAYWDRKGQRVRDVNAAYRNWLDRCPDLATVEALHAVDAPKRDFSAYDRAAGL